MLWFRPACWTRDLTDMLKHSTKKPRVCECNRIIGLLSDLMYQETGGRLLNSFFFTRISPVVSACSARFSVKWDCSMSTPFISGVLWVLRMNNVCIPKQKWASGLSNGDDRASWEIWNDLETYTVFSSGRANLRCVQFVPLVGTIHRIDFDIRSLRNVCELWSPTI
jgi:hypothetical protein